jgi:four helix bundle protein
MSQHLPIEETDLFRKFEEIASLIWDLVSTWKPFAQDTIGKQLVRAADSVGANLVEGDGRYTIPDSLHFFVIARGSARETQLWIRRSVSRKLINPNLGTELLEKIDHALRSLNSLMTFRRNKGNAVRETETDYDSPEHLMPNSEYIQRSGDQSEHLIPKTENLPADTGPP